MGEMIKKKKRKKLVIVWVHSIIIMTNTLSIGVILWVLVDGVLANGNKEGHHGSKDEEQTGGAEDDNVRFGHVKKETCKTRFQVIF